MTDLRGKRVLLLEDEALVAMMAEDFLLAMGAAVVGPAYSLAEAMRLIEEPVDVALLDVNIHGEKSESVARRLAERGVPIVFASGYAQIDLAPFPGARAIEKPYSQTKLHDALVAALAGD